MIMKKIKKAARILRRKGLLGLYFATKRFLHRIASKKPLVYYFDDILVLLGKKHIVKDILKNKMILSLTDKGLSRDLFHNGIREPENTKLYQSFLNKDDVILDIGANIGYFVLLASSITKGKIYALEPDHRSFNLLKKNISLNGLDKKVKTYHVAAGDKKGEINFYQEDYLNLSRVAKKNEVGAKVKMITVDDFCSDKKVSCLRFDVEGYEFFLLKGAQRLLSEKDVKIFMEVHPSLIEDFGCKLSDFFKMIEDFKVRYYVIPDEESVKNPSLFSIFLLFIAGKRLTSCRVINIDRKIKEIREDKKQKKLLDRKGTYHLFLEK